MRNNKSILYTLVIVITKIHNNKSANSAPYPSLIVTTQKHRPSATRHRHEALTASQLTAALTGRGGRVTGFLFRDALCRDTWIVGGYGVVVCGVSAYDLASYGAIAAYGVSANVVVVAYGVGSCDVVACSVGACGVGACGVSANGVIAYGIGAYGLAFSAAA